MREEMKQDRPGGRGSDQRAAQSGERRAREEEGAAPAFEARDIGRGAQRGAGHGDASTDHDQSDQAQHQGLQIRALRSILASVCKDSVFAVQKE